jgi:putative ABC transport system permease protein
VREIAPAEDAYLAEQRLPRATAEIAAVFAFVGLLTAAGGLFSVLTSAVGQRRHEFGIRSALGASPTQIRRLVVRDGVVIVGAGVAAGTIAGWLIGRLLASLLYGVTLADPAIWVAMVSAVAVVSLGAGWLPARQAARVDPVTLLREHTN